MISVAETVPPHAVQSVVATPINKSRAATLLTVLGLTLLGGTLRFSFLDRPPIWGDEAMTYMRVSGTYQQMLDALQDWGFAPLHYELYWVTRQLTPLTPFMMRLPTAIAGTLMIPAMYWLATQLAGRRVGLLAALLTACSAYLCNYSRDAKMYIDFWFFCVLNFACLLWWLRGRTRAAWWSWVASGVAMMGLNLLGSIVVGFEVSAVLTWPGGWLRREWSDWRGWGVLRRPALFLLGVAIMAAGPYGYYRYFNRYSDKLDRQGLAGGGLHWVEPYNAGRNAMDLLLFTTTAHLYSWEWTRPRDADQINPSALRWLKIAGIVILSLLALGALPWPREWTGFPTAGMSPPPNGVDAPMFRWPRALAILMAWLVLPAYAFYCMSMRNFIAPPEAIAALILKETPRVEWPTFRANSTETWSGASQQFQAQFSRSNLRVPQKWWQWVFLVGSIPAAVAWFILSAATWRQRFRKLGLLLAMVLTLLVICTIIYLVVLNLARYPGSVWMPRYLGMVWPALAIAVAVFLLRLPTRPLRWTAIALLVVVNLAVFSARVFASSEPPTPLMARDLLDSQPDDAKVRMYYAIPSLRLGSPGSGMLGSVPGAYYLTVFSGRPTNPQEMIGAFQGGRFGNFKRWTSLLPLPTYVAGDVSRSPQLETIIVWEKFNRERIDESDAIAEKLGPSWRRREGKLFPVRDHWTWRNLMTCRRRVYERIGPPSTVPATSPSTTRSGD